MTLAELSWIKERDRLFGRPQPVPEPRERKPKPPQRPDWQAITLDIFQNLEPTEQPPCLTTR